MHIMQQNMYIYMLKFTLVIYPCNDLQIDLLIYCVSHANENLIITSNRRKFIQQKARISDLMFLQHRYLHQH